MTIFLPKKTEDGSVGLFSIVSVPESSTVGLGQMASPNQGSDCDKLFHLYYSPFMRACVVLVMRINIWLTLPVSNRVSG